MNEEEGATKGPRRREYKENGNREEIPQGKKEREGSKEEAESAREKKKIACSSSYVERSGIAARLLGSPGPGYFNTGGGRPPTWGRTGKGSMTTTAVRRWVCRRAHVRAVHVCDARALSLSLPPFSPLSLSC